MPVQKLCGSSVERKRSTKLMQFTPRTVRPCFRPAAWLHRELEEKDRPPRPRVDHHSRHESRNAASARAPDDPGYSGAVAKLLQTVWKLCLKGSGLGLGWGILPQCGSLRPLWMASTYRRRALLGSNPNQQVGRAMRRLICSSSTSTAISIG